jgi:hypothetical protein
MVEIHEVFISSTNLIWTMSPVHHLECRLRDWNLDAQLWLSKTELVILLAGIHIVVRGDIVKTK